MKVAFIINDVQKIPAWYAATIDAVLKSNLFTVLFIHAPLQKEKKATPLFYGLFQKFEDRYFSNSNDADKPVAVKDLVQKNELISINAKSFYLDNHTLERLKQLHLDVIYTINFKITEQENTSTIARYGLWHLQPGYGKYYNSTPVAFWEVMDGSEVTGAYLLMRKACKDVILYEGTTTSKLYTVKNNYNTLLWKAANFLPARLQSLFIFQDAFSNRFVNTLTVNKSVRQQPRNAAMLQLFLKNTIGYLQHKVKSKKSGQPFALYYCFQQMQLNKLATLNFKRLPAAASAFYADPFVLKKDNQNYIFFEELENNKGHISVIAVEENNFTTPVKILEKPYHLSYPFVFEVDGNYYMIPESSANKTVELYKADSFPYKWTFVMNLMENVALLDSTLFYYNNKWWLFANKYDDITSANDQLLLFYSNDLLSNSWMPHPQNPVATHAENCRPAGRIFSANGKIYRPAQNNASQQYGFGIKINEIEVLTENDYREKEVMDLNPTKFGLKATHQIGFSDNLIVIDGVE